MTPYFSVVMPAYGVEKYIKRAIEHVQQQTFTDWELIIVDDAAKDKSGEIAEEMAKSDARIRVIHHEVNQGLSPARNTGMKAAAGKYIWFPDSDDWVELSLLEKAHESLEAHPAKVLIFGHHEEYFDQNGEYSYEHLVAPESDVFYNQQELREEMMKLEQATIYGYAWNKIYDLDYMRTIQLEYQTITLVEDILFNIEYFMNIDTMNTLKLPAYHYEKRMDGSLTNKFVPEYYKLHRLRIARLTEQLTYWNLLNTENKQILGSLYGRYILSALQRNCDPRANMNSRQRRTWMGHLHRDRLYQMLIPESEADSSKALTLFLTILRSGNITVTLLFGRMVYIIYNKLPMFYTKVRSGR